MKSRKLHKHATKLLALVLSMLMLLGAMPVAFAEESDIVVKWPTAAKEIEYGQTVADAGLNDDGEATIDGHFEYTVPTAKPGAGVSPRAVNFVPDDTSIAPVEGTVDVTINKSKSAVLEGGVPTASPIQAGQSLSESTITKTGIKFMNYGKSYVWRCEWKEPTKTIDKAGVYKETILCMPSSGGYRNNIETIEMDIEITVEGDIANTILISELPTASDINYTFKLSDSVLTGGLITKGGEPIPGTFAWKNPSTVPSQGTNKYPVVFTPDDPAVCEPMEMEVPVTVTKAELEITWPTLKAEFKGGNTVANCVTMEGGSANIAGKFQLSPDNKNPGKMGPADVVVLFIPNDRNNYDIVEKTFTVNFEAATPKPGTSVRFGANFDYRRKVVYISGSLGEGYNTAKDQATGTLYMVLDGERIAQTGRLGYDKTYVSGDTIAPGEHTVYTEYVAGENDVFKSAKSNVVTFTVIAFPDVTVNDSTGTVVEEYKAGDTVRVTAAEHEKPYYDFSGWTAEGVELTEEEKAQQTITFTMPEGDVNLTANYKFNFKNFVKYVFEQIGVKLMALIQQGIEWIKGLRP